MLVPLSSIVIALLATGAATSGLCSVGINPFGVGPRESYFWGTFTDRVVFAGDARLLSSLPGHWSMADSIDSVWGQVVRVRGFGGEGRRWFGGGGNLANPQDAIVVLWDYDAGCEPIPSSGPRPWGIPGDTAFFRVTPRTRNLWVNGTPTFDAYWAGEALYPFGATVHGREFQDHLRREFPDWVRPADSQVLTAVEAFNLLRALPEVCDYTRESATANARLRYVERQWQHRASDYAVQAIFNAHRALSRAGDRHLKDACSVHGRIRR